VTNMNAVRKGTIVKTITKGYICIALGALSWDIFVTEMAPELSRIGSWVCYATGMAGVILLSMGAHALFEDLLFYKGDAQDGPDS